MHSSSTSFWWLNPSWTGGQAEITKGVPHSVLSPAWQMLLLGDGSPTRCLQLLSSEETAVEVIEMHECGDDESDLAIFPDLKEIPGKWVRRQVFLQTASGKRLGYATSWWNTESISNCLKDKKIPIWASLSKNRMELYRDVRNLYHGESKELEEAFGEKGPFWGRHYIFWNGGKPLTLIYEVFSPYLNRYLGQQNSPTL